MRLRAHLLIMLLLPGLLAARGQRHTVVIDDMQFSPANLSIAVGDTVVWVNRDDRDHDVTSADGSFSSDNIKPGSSYSFQFTKSGRFAYSCSYHPRMKGMVVVVDK